ncbi:MAG: tRNA-(ms[2]io[6]A)-hydroxylase [Woeseiaceae bacterium]|nr:tRNA-(ms[2]io[6]A)-hydroxylase [Woeseiaceae bacterium]
MAVAAASTERIRAFLGVQTPERWLDAAAVRLPELLLDHANCELKAASSALAFIYRYPERDALAARMSRLAREELRHFEQVRELLAGRGIAFSRLSASRYAATLHEAVRRDEPARLLDMLLVGALIEARSCERFAALVPRLPDDIARFYSGLLASEARHFEHYLAFAREECTIDEPALAARIAELRTLENRAVLEDDPQFRFHSGPPPVRPLPP